MLVQRAGRLTSREELIHAVWPDTVVEENNLSVNISMLRKELGDSEEGERYIETVPRRGYRFVAQVKVGEGNSGAWVLDKRFRASITKEEMDGGVQSRPVNFHGAATVVQSRGREANRLPSMSRRRRASQSRASHNPHTELPDIVAGFFLSLAPLSSRLQLLPTFILLATAM